MFLAALGIEGPGFLLWDDICSGHDMFKCFIYIYIYMLLICQNLILHV